MRADLADLFCGFRLGVECRKGATLERIRCGFVDVVVVGDVGRRRGGVVVGSGKLGFVVDGRVNGVGTVDGIWVAAEELSRSVNVATDGDEEPDEDKGGGDERFGTN